MGKCNCGKKATVRGVYCGDCYRALKDHQRGRAPVSVNTDENVIETEEENVVVSVHEHKTHYNISGIINVKFKGQTHKIPFDGDIMKEVKKNE